MRNLVRLCCALAVSALITAASSPTVVRTSARSRAVAGAVAVNSNSDASPKAADVPPPPAAIISVNSTSDAAANDGLCTLREAITSANTNSVSGAASGECSAGKGDDMIDFEVEGVINLTGALPDVSSNVIISGPGSTRLTVRRDTGGDYRIFNVTSGTVTISGLTATNGRTPDGAAAPLANGGGIMNAGNLTLTSVAINANSTGAGVSGVRDSRGGDGGGIYNSGTLTMSDCSVSDNATGKGGSGPMGGSGGYGGGIYVEIGGVGVFNRVAVVNNSTGDFGLADAGQGGGSGGLGGGIFNWHGTVTLSGSSVSGNSTGKDFFDTRGQGGGVANFGDLNVTGSLISANAGASGSGIGNGNGALRLTNSTVSGNSGSFAVQVRDNPAATTFTNSTVNANADGGIGIFSSVPPVVGNTIIAGNATDASGAFNSQGHNLVGIVGTATGFGASGDQLGSAATPINPRLGSLADNGGPTKTHALLANSPAIDAGDNALAKDASNNTLTSDGRGAPSPRFADGPDADTTQTVDIGAFEAYPTVEDITDQLMYEDGARSFNFNVGDAAIGIASVTATSSDTTLVPNDAAHINVFGTGSQREFNATPAPGLNGTTTITVTVTATNGRTATDTFVLTILENDATVSAVSGSGPYGGTATLTAKIMFEDTPLQFRTINFKLNGNSVGSAMADASGVATLSGVPLQGLTPGTYPNAIDAIFTGDPTISGGSSTGPLTVVKADTTTTVTASNATYDGNPHGGTATVTGPGGLNQSLTVTYTGSGPYGPTTTPPTFAGDYTATATYAGDSNHNASSGSKNFSIAKADQTITFDAIPDKTFGDPDFTINATASSGLPVSFGTMDGSPCTVTGNTVHINSAQRCLITATQFGDSNHNGAAAVSRSFEIAKASTSVAVSSSVNPSAVGQAVTFTATVTSPAGFVPSGILGTVDFAADGVTIPNCASLLSATGQGTCTTSALSPGRHIITANYGTINQSFTGSTGTLQGEQVVGSLLEFSQASYDVAEGASLTVTVTRTGDTTQAASVGYATDDGSTPIAVVPCASTTGIALDRCDYTKALGTLHFAAGETSKTFRILVGDDSYAEGPETAHVRLSDASGASGLGTTSSATFTITDDSPESAGNTIDDTEAFVRQHYRDFLNREPDAAGLAFWKNEIEKCGNDSACRDVRRINVSAAFFKSIEFQQTGYLVYRTYKAAFGITLSPNVPGNVPVIRLDEFLPDTQRIGRDLVVGQGLWEQKLEANKVAYFEEFVARPRFANSMPVSLTPEQFVTTLADNANITLNPSRFQAAVGEFGGSFGTENAGARARAVRRVAEDPSLDFLERNRAFVLMEYYGYLRRNPDDAPQPGLNFSGWKFWLDKLNSFEGDFVKAEMVKAFLASDEYRKRFGQ